MKKVLIVDDNLLTLKQLEVYLSRYYEVLLADSGKMAVEICKAGNPDLILLDVKMPEMDGFETMNELKKNWRHGYVPVIFLTSDSDVTTEIKCLESGAMDFITKPVNKSILLHRIDLHLQLFAYQTNAEEVIKNLEDIIAVSMAGLIECQTDSCGYHGKATGRYTQLLGKELLRRRTFGTEFSEEELEKVARASALHDIGKIGVSDAILQKEDRLTAEEFEAVKKHPAIGSDALENIYKNLPQRFYFNYAALIAKGHHEKWDGTGYPDGLKGGDIPLFSRIVGLTSVYASCRSPRSYRPALSHRETCRIILEGKGTFFDPVIVDVFVFIEDKFDVLSKKIAEEARRE
jgi:putative two-component system response regulator